MKRAGRIEARVVAALIARKATLALAESCTGGLIGHRITSIAGSSTVFMGGVICYSNESKIRDLGVSKALIERRGAVSKSVARSMAEGVLSRFRTTLGVAVTGIAGPGGGSVDKPVGRVHLALAHERGTRDCAYCFTGTRESIKRQSSEAALRLLEQHLKKRGR